MPTAGSPVSTSAPLLTRAWPKNRSRKSSANAGCSAISKVIPAYPNATLVDQVQYRAQQTQQVNQLLNLVYGLLGLAVVIALIGIANTLALSIYERTRELGLLRAVGATQGQLRSIVRSEALIIALFGRFRVSGMVRAAGPGRGCRRSRALGWRAGRPG